MKQLTRRGKPSNHLDLIQALRHPINWLLGNESGSRRPGRRPERRLLLETLEERVVPDITLSLVNNTGLAAPNATYVSGWAGAGGSQLFVLDSSGNFTQAGVTIASAVSSGTTATITTNAAHGLSVNDSITITNVSVADYNGAFTVASVTNSTTFTYTTLTSDLGAGAGGSVQTLTAAPVVNLANLSTVTIGANIDNISTRMTFYVSGSTPTGAAISGTNVTAPATPPFQAGASDLPAVFDILEFTYINGGNSTFDVSAVNGFALPLTLSGSTISGPENIGVQLTGVTREQIGNAFSSFTSSDPLGADFAQLLYNSSNGGAFVNPTSLVPQSQFYNISDPNDFLVALAGSASSNSLASYWDDTLNNFFADGNFLSINLSAGAPNIYSGSATGGTYTLTNGSNTYNFSHPGTGLAGAEYVFGQAFASAPEPDEGLIQDNIWQALSRGVALDGVSKSSITAGETTTAWNDFSQWYKQHTSTAFPAFQSIYNTYAKFLHYSTVNGTDSRDGGTPIFIGNAAYGFSEDENPNGPYSGGEVPSKFDGTVADGTTLTLTIGEWGSATPPPASPTLQESLDSNEVFTVIGATGSPDTILSVKIFDGQGNLVDSVQPFNNLTSLRVAAGDFDGDGKVDEFAVLGRRSNSDLRAEIVTYDLSDTGQATETARFFAFAPGILGNGFITAGDFDGDGDDDLAVTQIGGGRAVVTLQVHVSAGGTFSMGGAIEVNFGIISAPRVGAGDTDGDGRDEIVIAVRTPDGARVLVFDATDPTQTPMQQGAGFLWDFGVTGYARGAFVTVGEFDPLFDGQEIVLGSNVGGGGRVDIVHYDGAGSAELVTNGRLTPFGDSYNAAVRVAVGKIVGTDARIVLVAGEDRFQNGEYTILARDFDGTQVNPDFESIPPIKGLTAANGQAPGGGLLGPFVSFANATLLNGGSSLLAPSVPGADLLDGDPDDFDLAAALFEEEGNELDELFML